MKFFTVGSDFSGQPDYPTFVTMWQAKRFARKYYHSKKRDAFIAIYETYNVDPDKKNWMGRLYIWTRQVVIFFQDFPLVREWEE